MIPVKTFEMSSKLNKRGRRPFKAILHEVYPDSCIDYTNGVGNQYNENGICWIEEYCEQALPSIAGMSLKVEFADPVDRTEIIGHGMTDIQDGIPIFEDATLIGHFTKGYIDTIQTDDGEKRVCIGEGEFDASCYPKLNQKLDEELALGNFPECSVEIYKTADEDNIVYAYGYKDKGRIPKKFDYLGLAILGIRPADKISLLIELNQKNKEDTMLEKEQFDALVSAVTENVKQIIVENNSVKKEYEDKIAECDQKIADAEQKVADKEVECNTLSASVEKIQVALDEAREEIGEKYKEIENLYQEADELRKELAKAQAERRVAEMNSALEKFSDEEKGYAKDLIDAFNEDPMKVEINSVLDRIYTEIGKKTKETNKTVEANSAKPVVEDMDIFGEVVNGSTVEDTNIF